MVDVTLTARDTAWPDDSQGRMDGNEVVPAPLMLTHTGDAATEVTRSLFDILDVDVPAAYVYPGSPYQPGDIVSFTRQVGGAGQFTEFQVIIAGTVQYTGGGNPSYLENTFVANPALFAEVGAAFGVQMRDANYAVTTRLADAAYIDTRDQVAPSDGTLVHQVYGLDGVAHADFPAGFDFSTENLTVVMEAAPGLVSRDGPMIVAVGSGVSAGDIHTLINDIRGLAADGSISASDEAVIESDLEALSEEAVALLSQALEALGLEVDLSDGLSQNEIELLEENGQQVVTKVAELLGR